MPFFLPSLTNLVKAYIFAHITELDQLVQHPARMTDHLGDRPRILDLFPTSNPSAYTVHFYSDHKIISVSCNVSPEQPLDSWKMCFSPCQIIWNCVFLISCSNYCFRIRVFYVLAKPISIVIVYGMEACNPHAFSSSLTKKIVIHTCSCVVKEREAVYMLLISIHHLWVEANIFSDLPKIVPAIGNIKISPVVTLQILLASDQ